MDQRADRRAQLGASAASWSSAGRHLVEAGRWVALSGASSTTVNIALCSGPDSALVSRSLADVAEVAAPGIVMLGGDALGSAQVLVDAGWVCVGSTPFMQLNVSAVTALTEQSTARRLGADDLAAARAVVNDVYASKSDVVADVVLPDGVMTSDWVDVWGLELEGELAAVVVAATVDDVAGIWFMCTRRDRRRQGHGRRLLAAALSELVVMGRETVLLYASRSATPLYLSVGFEIVEHWQQWSRPRWILGRA